MMTTNNIKPSAIPYAGYDYQTLQGIRILARWLETPTKYRRVRFEADDDFTPQGIDDIVCERDDGLYDFLQVKFTPSPDKEENQLSWEWLLHKNPQKPRSKPLLKKWFDAVSSVEKTLLGKVSLLTNREPNSDFEQCLKAGKIDYTLAPLEIQTQLNTLLGSESNARQFLNQLFINHSDKNYLSLAREVREALSHHTDEAGIHRLQSNAREWAIFKKNPAPDGWITIATVRALLSTHRPDPIPEDFIVPIDYSVPDEAFHEALKAEIKNTTNKVFIVTGPPGRGKSTYLSFLNIDLEGSQIPVIRHHYFLSVTDRNDRLSYRMVAESLLSQIERLHSHTGAPTDKPESLSIALEKCSIYYQTHNKPFVVIIDGLDHVWRDNDRDKAPLDALFKQLLPAPKNMVLIIGTQPVDDNKLPDRLIRACERSQWRVLPPMSGNAVLDYLNVQIEAGRLTTNVHHKTETLQESAKALLTLTQGHPLHVIYAIEELVNAKLPLSSWQIERLPTCPGPDIRSYYNELWSRLTPSQRDVIHLCCAFSFFWPRSAFTEMGMNQMGSPSILAVEHLLHSAAAGLRPFHESLIVFVKETSEHSERITQLLPSVRNWLESYAPKSLRKSWLWSIELRIGNTSPLLTGLTRDWVLDLLAKGYPLETPIRLLTEAEETSFLHKRYALAYRFRALKTRLLNAPEFGLNEMWRLEQCTWALSEDLDVLTETFSIRHQLSLQQLIALGMALIEHEDSLYTPLIGKEILEKHHRESRLYVQHHQQEQLAKIANIVEAATKLGSFNLEFFAQEGRLNKWPIEYTNALCKALISSGCLADIMLLRQSIDNSLEQIETRESLEVSALKTAVPLGIALTDWHEFQGFNSSTFVACWAASIDKCLNNFPSQPLPLINSESPTHTASSKQIYEWFFKTLLILLTVKESDCSLLRLETHESNSIHQYLNTLTIFAKLAAEKIKRCQRINFEDLFLFLNTQTFEDYNFNDYEKREARSAFFQSLVNIALDCHLLGVNNTSDWQIPYTSLTRIEESQWFNYENFNSIYRSKTINFLTNEAVLFVIEHQLKHYKLKVTNVSQITENLLCLTEIATRHKAFDQAKILCRLCWDYVIGYGYHKDMALNWTLDAIEYLSMRDPDSALEALTSLAPQINNITDYTDGDETGYAHNDLHKLLARLSPIRLVQLYSDQIKQGESYRADDALNAILKYGDLSSPFASSLARTGLNATALVTLTQRAENGDSHARTLVIEAKKHNGVSSQTDSNREAIETKSTIEDFAGNPVDYPPTKFNQLRLDMAKLYGQSRYLKKWYTYWKDRNQESKLLRMLKPILTHTEIGTFDEAKHLLDLLFDTAFRLEGSRKAFDIAVRAQIEMRGWWSYFFEQHEDSEARLHKVAQKYASRADEFIQKTCINTLIHKQQPSTLIIPSEKLVYFLVQLDRLSEAKDLVNAMVNSVKEDTRNLPLITPNWTIVNPTTDNDEVWLNILIARLDWPVPSIKLWVAQELAHFLLDSNYKEMVEKALLKNLEEKQFESEVLEILSIFWLANQHCYKADSNLGKNIRAKSTLSSMFMDDLLPHPRFTGQLSAELLLAPFNFNPSSDFEKAQGSTTPLGFLHAMEELEDETGYPFTAQYAFEWECSLSRIKPINDTWRYFYSYPYDKMTGHFFTQQSHRGRSAYLRTIEVAQRYWGMPPDRSKYAATMALPINPTMAFLKPLKPNWLQIWDIEQSIDTESISDFIEKCITAIYRDTSEFVLGGMSFPVLVNDSTWIDISCTLWAQWEEGVMNAQDLINKIPNEHNAGASIGDGIDTKTIYHIESPNSRRGNCLASPLFGSVFPLRHGVFHSDIEARGLQVPLLHRRGVSMYSQPSAHELAFFANGREIALAGYWNANWTPAHRQELKPLCGTVTLIRRAEINQLNEAAPLRTFYVWKAQKLCIEQSYGDAELEAFSGIIFLDKPAITSPTT